MASSAPVPFSDPPYLMGLPSPYYTESHRKWQQTCRNFISDNLLTFAGDWEKTGEVPAEMYTTFANARMLIPNLPAPLPIKWLKKAGIHELPGGLKVEDYDYLHTLIYVDEMARVGSNGPGGALTVGLAFGLPPILNFGSEELQNRFIPDLLLGTKRICIAITEPEAGSDVANLSTTAIKSPDGRHYIVNGTKKWITNGIWSDYASMAVRTGGPGASGISLLVVPLKGHPGVTMRRLTVGGQSAAGTTFITLEDVFVPVENLIGQEGHGMLYTMKNFNHERLSIAIGANRLSRVAISSAFEYCLKREAFGKTLMDQPVVRNRLAKAGALLESHWAWIEQFVYQLNNMSEEKASIELGGLTALAKAHAGIVLDECARCAVLLFGGAGYTKSGQGQTVEQIYREVPGIRIPGGSEDVLLDLAIRQLVKNFKQQTAQLQKASKM